MIRTTRVFAFTGLVLLFGVAATHTVAQETNAELTAAQKLERLLVAAQKICPVSGKDLTSMGGPIRAKVGERTVYLCCKGCFKSKIDAKHAAQVEKNLIAAQGKCPIMGKQLPVDPKSIVVEGRKIFVCCPPCTEKIKADSKTHLVTVNKFLAENLTKQRQTDLPQR